MQHVKNYVVASLIAFLACSLIAPSRTCQHVSAQTSPAKFVKHKRAIPNHYIVVLNDDVVSNDAPLEARRARVTAIAQSHARTYRGKVDYIYETALKGYAIQLPNEAAAIAISKLPQVKWVEEDALGEFGPSSAPPQTNGSACRGKSIPVALLDVGHPKEPEPRRLSLFHGGGSQRSRRVIRNRDEFSELWKQIVGAGSDRPPPPEVDFTRVMLIVAAMGTKPSSGYEITIDGACEVDNHIEVFVRSVDYSKCGLQLQVITAPLDIVQIPRTELPVVFRETEISSDCKELLRPSRPQALKSSYDETRALLLKMERRSGNRELQKLFKEADLRMPDLVKALSDSETKISVNAQVIINYLADPEGLRALDEWYNAQKEQQRTITMPGMTLLSAPKYLQGSDSDLAKLALKNRQLFEAARFNDGDVYFKVIAHNKRQRAALLEVVQGQIFTAGWHAVIRQDNNRWRLVSDNNVWVS